MSLKAIATGVKGSEEPAPPAAFSAALAPASTSLAVGECSGGSSLSPDNSSEACAAVGLPPRTAGRGGVRMCWVGMGWQYSRATSSETTSTQRGISAHHEVGTLFASPACGAAVASPSMPLRARTIVAYASSLITTGGLGAARQQMRGRLHRIRPEWAGNAKGFAGRAQRCSGSAGMFRGHDRPVNIVTRQTQTNVPGSFARKKMYAQKLMRDAQMPHTKMAIQLRGSSWRGSTRQEVVGSVCAGWAPP
jgi:hypothetical protein